MTTKNIAWLASYPKSGNTWLRVFLANYIFNLDQPVPINQIHRLGMGDAITKTYEMVAGRPIDPADIDLTLKLRPKVLQGIAGNGADLNFVKTHNIRDRAMGLDLIPTALTKQAIYILRNPLDVAVSYARHYQMGLEEATEAIGRTDNVVIGTPGSSVTQFLGRWSDHVQSWTRHKDFPVLVLRYEDMEAEGETAFAKVIGALGLPMGRDRLLRAIQFSSFKELSAQEKQAGFIERPEKAERFFHTGTSGQWQKDLPAELVERITHDHRPVMQAHGYLA